MLQKSARVETNDINNQFLPLIIEGQVEAFASINPRYLRLYGEVGKEISAKVSIIPSEKYGFTILEARAIKGEHISTKLEKFGDQKDQEYVLVVENTLKEKGRYNDTVRLKTDSKIRPVLFVKVYGNIFERPQKTQQ